MKKLNKRETDLLMRHFTAQRNIWLQGVLFREGVAYASDGYILSAIRCGYDEEMEGKVLFPDTSIKTNGVDYRTHQYWFISNKATENPIETNVNPEMLDIGVNRVYRLNNGERGKKRIDSQIVIGKYFFPANLIKRGIDLLKYRGEAFKVMTIPAGHQLLLQSVDSRSVVVIVGVREDTLPNNLLFTPSQAFNYDDKL